MHRTLITIIIFGHTITPLACHPSPTPLANHPPTRAKGFNHIFINRTPFSRACFISTSAFFFVRACFIKYILYSEGGSVFRGLLHMYLHMTCGTYENGKVTLWVQFSFLRFTMYVCGCRCISVEESRGGFLRAEFYIWRTLNSFNYFRFFSVHACEFRNVPLFWVVSYRKDNPYNSTPSMDSSKRYLL